MKLVKVIVFLIALPAMADDAGAQQATRGTPPNGKLEVAYRQLEGGKLSDSVYLLSLWCTDGQCSLTTLTLNECRPLSEGQGFFPKIERSTTDDRVLSVVETDPGTVSAEDKVDGATFRYHFTYSTRTDAGLAKAMRARGTRWFDKLIGFSGGVVKHSPILQRVVTWELIPVRATGGGIALMEPKCKIAVSGIP